MIDLFGNDDTVLTKSVGTCVNVYNAQNVQIGAQTGIPVVVCEVTIILSFKGNVKALASAVKSHRLGKPLTCIQHR